jgi:hypothetical protein
MKIINMPLSTLVNNANNALNLDIRIFGRRAAYFANEVDEAFWLSRDDLVYAIACAKQYPRDAYSHWCASSGSVMGTRRRRELFGK